MGMSYGEMRNKECPCGSQRKAKKCCLQPDGIWNKATCTITPPPPPTGFSNPKCWARVTRDCSPQASREQYVSGALLRAIDDKIKVSGFAWQKPNTSNSLRVGNLVSKVLCKRHNEAFSPLDEEAGRFFRAVRSASDSRCQLPTGFFLFSGKDIERWLLKTLYGLLSTDSLQDVPGVAITDVPIDRKCLDLLYDRRLWEPRRGLYIRTQRGHTSVTENSASASPVLNRRKGTIQGLCFNFVGFDFLLATTTINVESSVHRPRQIIFRKGHECRVIELSWENPAYRVAVEFTWRGRGPAEAQGNA